VNGEHLREMWEELRDNWDDPYWRLDHQEMVIIALALISGLIGLAFALVQTVLQTLIERRLADA
jgi:hypothetical protein